MMLHKSFLWKKALICGARRTQFECVNKTQRIVFFVVSNKKFSVEICINFEQQLNKKTAIISNPHNNNVYYKNQLQTDDFHFVIYGCVLY